MPSLTPTSSLRNVLFVPHGAPTFALNPGAAGAAMSQVAQQLAPPRAIVVVSPHWETALPTVGLATQLETIHDFFGFPSPLYDIRYPASGCPEAAREVVSALQAHGFEVQTDDQRGLDHGAWIPLRQMFPEADVPVIPLSVQSHAGPAHAYRIGQALAALAAHNIWILGSGNVTHNLGDLRIARMQGDRTPAYVQVFADWLADHLAQGDLDRLLNYRQHSPEGVRAHPSEEHLLPLFTALGAAGPDAVPQAFHRGISDCVIAMDGYAFQTLKGKP
jgi:4,5-DOPA dioxygenase extradiol